MAKEVKSADKKRLTERSHLSDEIPALGIGIVPSYRDVDSMRRCFKAVTALFDNATLPFSSFGRHKIQEYLSEDALQTSIMTYWYEYDYDRRTKRTDLKRELKKVVTHLRPLNKAMGKVHKRTRATVNYRIHEGELLKKLREDVFELALRTNDKLENACEKLVKGKYVKSAPICLNHLAARMIGVWEALSGERFRYNTQCHEAERDPPLTGESKEFQGPEPHFLHVVLRAIDPTVTRAKVASSIKNLAPKACAKKDPKSK